MKSRFKAYSREAAHFIENQLVNPSSASFYENDLKSIFSPNLLKIHPITCTV